MCFDRERPNDSPRQSFKNQVPTTAQLKEKLEGEIETGITGNDNGYNDKVSILIKDQRL